MSPQPIDSLCIRSSILPIAPDEDHTIGFRHAGYPVEDVILLKLRAYDRLDGGLHHATALTACGIIAGNTWNGYLSLERGGEAIELGMDGLLSTGREYWFHIPHPPGTGEIACSEYPLVLLAIGCSLTIIFISSS
jgi:hypothetical protein